MKPHISRLLAIGCLAFLAACLLAAAPGLAQAPVSAAEDVYAYTIVRGDTPLAISRRLLRDPNDWRRVLDFNGIRDPRRLVPRSTLLIPWELLKAGDAPARVVEVVGNVTSGGVPVAVGSSLPSGSAVQTGADGLVTIQLADGSRLRVQAASKLELERLRRLPEGGYASRVFLREGRVESHSEKQGGPNTGFTIRTPGAQAGVRGTAFRVASGSSVTRTEVLDGRVGVSASGRRGETAVAAGFGAAVDATGDVRVVPLLPAPDLSALPARIERVDAPLTWPPVPGARAYRIQIATDAAFQRVLRDALATSAAHASGPLPDGSYFIRVRAIDPNGIEGRDTDRPLQIAARPIAPQPIRINRTADQAIAFRWTPAPEAATYRLQVARDADFNSLVVDRAGITGGEYITPMPGRSGTYHWRVASVRSDGYRGPWSEIERFEQVDRSPPIEDPIALGDVVVLRWSGETGQRFRVQLSADRYFGRDVRELKVDTNRAVFEGLDQGTYYARVETTEADGLVRPFSLLQSVEVTQPPLPWWVLVIILGFLL